MPSWVWLILFFIATCLMALHGIKADQGWVEFAQSAAFTDAFYGVLQLFVLDNAVLDDVTTDVPVTVRIAQFSAPLVTIFAFLQLIWREIIEGVQAAMLRHVRRDHLVIIGYGRKGRLLAIDASRRGHHVVAVDVSPGRKIAELPDNNRIPLIIADGRTPGLVNRVGAQRAQAIVIFCGGDRTSVSVARTLSAAVGARTGTTRQGPRIICNAASAEMADQTAQDQIIGQPAGPIIEFFSPEQASARQLFSQYPPQSYARVFRQHQIHLCIYGLEKLGVQVVMHGIVACQRAVGPRPRFTIIHDKGSDHTATLARLAAVSTVADICLVATNLGCNLGLCEEVAQAARTATQHIVCFDNDDRANEFAIHLKNELTGSGLPNAPIWVGTMAEGNGSTLQSAPPHAESVVRQFATNLIFSFGNNPSALSWPQVVAAHQDRLAKKNHQNYLDHLARNDATPHPLKTPAAVPWSRLAENYRNSNRYFVDHLTMKMQLIEATLSPRRTTLRLTNQEIETLAKAEHNRWSAEKLFDGWTFAPVRHDGRKHHPDLVKWDDLSDAVKSNDKALVGALDDMLSASDQSITRVCRIGVSGHRHADISLANRRLCDQITAQLKEIEHDNPERQFIILSALAEGSDRVVAQLAMEQIGAKLHVVLPMPIAEYRRDFVMQESAKASEKTDQSIAEFEQLIGRAVWISELPGLGTRSSAQGGETGSTRQNLYAQVGAYLVQQCEEMIFVWDGQPARGVGGTAEVVAWRGSAVPDHYKWPEQLSLDPGRRQPARIVKYSHQLAE